MGPSPGARKRAGNQNSVYCKKKIGERGQGRPLGGKKIKVALSPLSKKPRTHFCKKPAWVRG